MTREEIVKKIAIRLFEIVSNGVEGEMLCDIWNLIAELDEEEYWVCIRDSFMKVDC
jgi:hypothetical protein